MTSDATLELAMGALVILLAVAVGLWLGRVLRRRAAAAGEAAPVEPEIPAAPARVAAIRQAVARRARASQAQTSQAHSGALGGVSTSSSAPGTSLVPSPTARVCPSCRTAYEDMLYCQRDARRLVPAEELATGARATGLACPGCGRGFEPGLRRCPHDGVELVPHATYAATRGRPPPAPTGVLAKVCPLCRRKFDLSSRFCGRDGHELVVIN